MRNIDLENCKGQIFRHFKGDIYLFLDIGEHTETGELMVIYKALYENCKLYIRPLNMFLSKVDKFKYPDAIQEYRFELIILDSTKNILNNS